MKSIFWLFVGIVALIGFTSYVAFGETGPIGWVNALQVAVLGSYSRRLSAILLMLAAILPVMGILALVAPASLQRNAQKVEAVIEAPIPRPRSMSKKAVAGWTCLAWAACVALAWAAVYASALWDRHTRNADAKAAYVPLQLTPGMKDAAAGREHLALRGQMLGDHVVSRKKGNDGSEAMMLVPVVEPGWHEGDPVHFVVRFGAEGQYALRKVLQQPSESLRVRTDGSVPTLARQVFERLRAPLADDAVALVLVADQGGDPATAVPDAGYGEVVQTGLIWTGLVTGLFAMIAAAMVGSARQARKQTSKRAGATAR